MVLCVFCTELGALLVWTGVQANTGTSVLKSNASGSLPEGFDRAVMGVMGGGIFVVLVRELFASVLTFATLTIFVGFSALSVASEIFTASLVFFSSEGKGGPDLCSDFSRFFAFGGFQVQTVEKSSSGGQPLCAAKVTNDTMALVAARLALTGLSAGDGEEFANFMPASRIVHTPLALLCLSLSSDRAMQRYTRPTTSSTRAGLENFLAEPQEGSSRDNFAPSLAEMRLQRSSVAMCSLILARYSAGSRWRSSSACAAAQRAVALARQGSAQHRHWQPESCAREESQRRGADFKGGELVTSLATASFAIHLVVKTPFKSSSDSRTGDSDFWAGRPFRGLILTSAFCTSLGKSGEFRFRVRVQIKQILQF